MSHDRRLIEHDEFPFEFVSKLAEKESWRKEIHRPIYHVHKWWAKRLGSVFRAMILGCKLSGADDLADEFYLVHKASDVRVFDPFMGSGTTIGEAHKLGFIALGRDINPVAVSAVRSGLGNLDELTLRESFDALSSGVGNELRSLYKSTDAEGNECNVLYYFWVMMTACPSCYEQVELFSTYEFARNARPKKKTDTHCICPKCRDVFKSTYGQEATCPTCTFQFDPTAAIARGSKATCDKCNNQFRILDSLDGSLTRPSYGMYAKLVLLKNGMKQYLPTSSADVANYEKCSTELKNELRNGSTVLPHLELEFGHNTKQAMNYGFRKWADFFNDRQLLALTTLQKAINDLPQRESRKALLTLFSGVLEFNNLFASYKGEGTGAVRHMFSHHILKPERMPIEANVWGTEKSSGSFSNLFPTRLLRAANYQASPTDLVLGKKHAQLSAMPMSGRVEDWPTESAGLVERGIYLSCGDSSETELAANSIDFVVTDPPFFDNVHYSELADFFHAWQESGSSTRRTGEVQDGDAEQFSKKLQRVFTESCRVMKDEGLLVFSYHHSRSEGWSSLVQAILSAGLVVVNSQPIKAEMSVATPKTQAKEPIQFDVIIVCRKRTSDFAASTTNVEDSLVSAKKKAKRLIEAGFSLSKNDWRIIQFGQLLSAIRSEKEFKEIEHSICSDLSIFEDVDRPHQKSETQLSLF